MFNKHFKQFFSPVSSILARSLLKNKLTSDRPLLDFDEIHDLYLQATQLRTSRQHLKEVAHKRTGDKRSIYKGYGLDYEESRHYITGDDPRYMNWNLTARTGQLFMKVFRQERQPGIFIVIDRRINMRFGTTRRLKITQAIRIAALTAFNAQLDNKLVGGVIIDSELTWLRETQNKQEIFDFINKAANPLPDFNVYEPKDEKDSNITVNLQDILLLLNNIITRGSSVYLISDFSGLQDQSRAALIQLSTEHEVTAIKVTDVGEFSLPATGQLKFFHPETGHTIDADTSDSTSINQFQLAANKEYSRRKKILSDSGIPCIEVSTSDNDINFYSADIK